MRSDFTNNTSACVQPETFLFTDDGKFPNRKLPLLVYGQAVQGDGADPAAAFEHCFATNDWTNSWRNGVYPFMHYHSASAEVLGAYHRSAQIRVGGDRAQTLKVAAGEVILIPAGVPQPNAGSSPDFGVVGAYPEGRGWDVLRGLEGERPQADRKIVHVPIPKNDPLYGANGPLKQLWIFA